MAIILSGCVDRERAAAGLSDAEHGAGVATRVVTLSPHLAELIYAVGAGDSLVGVSAYTDYPEAAASLPMVGDAFLLDQEQLAILQPDMLLAWESGTPPHVVDELRSIGFRVETIRTRGLPDVALALEKVGSLTGHSAQAEAVASTFRKALAALASQYAGSDPIRAFYQVSSQPLYTVNGEHFVSDLIEVCGGSNIFADLGDLAPLVSVEAVLARDPEAILAAGDLDQSVFSGWRRWDYLHANRYGNYFLLPAAEIGRPTPRLLQAGKAMCAALQRARERRAAAATG